MFSRRSGRSGGITRQILTTPVWRLPISLYLAPLFLCLCHSTSVHHPINMSQSRILDRLETLIEAFRPTPTRKSDMVTRDLVQVRSLDQWARLETRFVKAVAKSPILAFDTEDVWNSRPARLKYVMAASMDGLCLIFDVDYVWRQRPLEDTLPKCLVAFLTTRKVIKLGSDVKKDLMATFLHTGAEFLGPCLDTQYITAKMASLGEIAPMGNSPGLDQTSISIWNTLDTSYKPKTPKQFRKRHGALPFGWTDDQWPEYRNIFQMYKWGRDLKWFQEVYLYIDLTLPLALAYVAIRSMVRKFPAKFVDDNLSPALLFDIFADDLDREFVPTRTAPYTLTWPSDLSHRPVDDVEDSGVVGDDVQVISDSEEESAGVETTPPSGEIVSAPEPHAIAEVSSAEIDYFTVQPSDVAEVDHFAVQPSDVAELDGIYIGLTAADMEGMGGDDDGSPGRLNGDGGGPSGVPPPIPVPAPTLKRSADDEALERPPEKKLKTMCGNPLTGFSGPGLAHHGRSTFPVLTCCLRCGQFDHKRQDCTTEIMQCNYRYCRATDIHAAQACKAYVKVCKRCRLRGHASEDCPNETEADREAYRDWFETMADFGPLVRDRRRFVEFGVFHFRPRRFYLNGKAALRRLSYDLLLSTPVFRVIDFIDGKIDAL